MMENKQLFLDFGVHPFLLLSLHPGPYDQIKSGRKKYEYRRKFIDGPSRAFIYVTSPVKAISGLIEIGAPIIDTPKRIAEIAEKEKCGSGHGTKEYLNGLEKGYAIPILSFWEIKPVGLEELREKFQFSAPQSYMYLSHKPHLLLFLKNRSHH